MTEPTPHPQTSCEEPRRANPWLDVAILAVTLVIMLGLGWMRWPDAFIDFGRELYIPWQLKEGQALYTDIAYFNGPLSPYVNAVAFLILGTGLRTLLLVNLALICIAVWAIHRLVAEMAGRAAALVGSVVFLTVFALARLVRYGSYNYLCPYSHEMTHGVLLSLLALVFLAGYVRSGRTRALVAAGLALGLVFLTKAEIFLALVPALVLGVVLAPGVRGNGSARGWRAVATLTGTALVPPIVAFALLATVIPPETALLGTLGSWPHVSVEEVRELQFYRWVMGTHALPWNLGKLALAIVGHVAVLGTVLVVALRIRPPIRGGWRAGLIAGGLLLGGLVFVLTRAGSDHVARPFPFILAAIAIGLGVTLHRARRTGRVDGRRVLSLSVTVFALLMLLKIFLRSQFHHYGFVLAMPATLVVTAWLVGWVPEWVRARGGHPGICRGGMVIVWMALVLVYGDVSRRLYRDATNPVGQGADAFVADYPGIVADRALSRLQTVLRPGDRFAVLPEGVMLNYLARVENPTPYINFMPPELILFGEDRMLEAFAADPPEYCVLMNRGAYEYGFNILGRDYGIELMEWVQANYELVEQVRDEENLGKPFTLALIVRRIVRSP